MRYIRAPDKRSFTYIWDTACQDIPISNPSIEVWSTYLSRMANLLLNLDKRR